MKCIEMGILLPKPHVEGNYLHTTRKAPTMPPRARSTAPEFLTSATLGELIAAELETLAAPPPDGHDGYPAAPSPIERARRSMLNRAAQEIRDHHTPAGDD